MSKEIDWQNVNKVLVVRLRSIGDTVLSTPSLIALRRFLPDTQIDMLLEDWVAPVLDGFETIDNVLVVSKDTKDRIKLAKKLRKEKYDVAFNLHGGTTATLLIRASGAKHRVGYKSYQYSFLYNHLLNSAADFWQNTHTHSAEHQLALIGFVGIPVEDKPKSRLSVTKRAIDSLSNKIDKNPRSQISDFKREVVSRKLRVEEQSKTQNLKSKIALFHPVAAFDTKQWATENFARVAEFLVEQGFQIIAVATKKEQKTLETLERLSNVSITTLDNLTLPEITALASKVDLFVGNDSGIAHIAASVKTPSVVIFGSSNRNHWRPWTDAPNEIVHETMPCQPCAGHVCKKFDEPKCILEISVEKVKSSINKVLSEKDNHH